MSKVVFFIFLCLYFSSYWCVSAQIVHGVTLEKEQIHTKLTMPFSTTLFGKTTGGSVDHIYSIYRYHSRLSQDDILDYYRDLLLSQGFREVQQRSEDIFLFSRGALAWAQLSFYEKEGNQTTYALSVTETQHIFAFSYVTFRKPEALGFAPTYSRATQFTEISDNPGGISVAYLAPGNVKDLIDFYCKEMPGFNWKLKSQYPFNGTHGLYDALATGLSESDDLKRIGSERFPGIILTLEGTNLIFYRENQQCIVTFIQFQDSPQVLKERMVIDPTYLERYGRTLIYLQYKKVDTIQEKKQYEDETE